jgi:hypothetical protein
VSIVFLDDIKELSNGRCCDTQHIFFLLLYENKLECGNIIQKSKAAMDREL